MNLKVIEKAIVNSYAEGKDLGNIHNEVKGINYDLYGLVVDIMTHEQLKQFDEVYLSVTSEFAEKGYLDGFKDGIKFLVSMTSK